MKKLSDDTLRLYAKLEEDIEDLTICKPEPLENGEPCEHSGCLHHTTHPCEGCGRIAGSNLPNKAYIEYLAQKDPILYHSLKIQERLNLNWEQTLMFMVKHLVEQNDLIKRDLINISKITANPLFRKE